MGHSTTALVRRYAHPSPSHLQGVVEMVSQFGKQDKAIKQSQGLILGVVQPAEIALAEGTN